jgi:hypothetical protein
MKRLLLILPFCLSLVGAEIPTPAGEYLEIDADIDGDGIADRLVSEPIRDFGNAGGHWEVFLGKNEGLVSAGSIFAHPLALRTEKLFDSVRIWVYSRASGSSGGLGFYVLKDGRISDLKMIDISPGDGGTDLGRTIYDTVFPPEKRFITNKKTPNQALQTTTTAVARRAYARHAPARPASRVEKNTNERNALSFIGS